jgi:hypothetical protein
MSEMIIYELGDEPDEIVCVGDQSEQINLYVSSKNSSRGGRI